MKISNFMQKSPVIPLILIGKELQSILEVQFRKLNLNIVDALVLSSIFFEGSLCRPSEIAKSLELSRSQVSQSLKRLEQACLVERSLGKTDLRILNLRLTASGKNKNLKVIKIFDDVTTRIESVLSEKVSENMATKLIDLRRAFVDSKK